MLQENWGNKPE